MLKKYNLASILRIPIQQIFGNHHAKPELCNSSLISNSQHSITYLCRRKRIFLGYEHIQPHNVFKVSSLWLSFVKRKKKGSKILKFFKLQNQIIILDNKNVLKHCSSPDYQSS